MPRPPRSRSVWRIALLWQGTVLDVATVSGSRALELRTGERLQVRIKKGALCVDGIGEISNGEVIELSAGHTLVATEEIPEAKAGAFSSLDSTLFHAAMIGAAVQACVVSALVLAPAPTFDSEPGAGFPGEWRRALIAPGGTAPVVGAASLAAVGRKPDEVERPEPQRQQGRPSRSPVGKQMTVEQELAEMSRILQLGNDGTALKEAVGDLARSTAHAPVVGADFGGLAPKDPLMSGEGNGLIGAGKSQLSDLLHRRIAENEKKLTRLTLKNEPRPKTPIPVQLLELPDDVYARLTSEASLDPIVKEALTKAVRKRDGAVRACYESRALAADGTRAGRLKLKLTLLPSGHVQDVDVEVDNPQLASVAACVKGIAADWYLGDGLVEEPQQLAFPFVLMPKRDVGVYDFSVDR